MSKKLKIILDERQQEYGDALQNFTDIGIIWGTLLGIEPLES